MGRLKCNDEVQSQITQGYRHKIYKIESVKYDLQDSGSDFTAGVSSSQEATIGEVPLNVKNDVRMSEYFEISIDDCTVPSTISCYRTHSSPTERAEKEGHIT